MPFTVISGTFHVLNYSPDGDSIRFAPDDPSLLQRLDGPPARRNQRGHVQLRIEGIDTLEMHYAPPSGGGVFAQPPVFARSATLAMLEFSGIRDVVWSSDGHSVVSAHDGTPGHILTREVEKNGRPVAFVFAGKPGEADGASVALDTGRLQSSYNYQALREGLAYATYYTGLFSDLRQALTDAVQVARTARAGLYAADTTNTPFELESLSSLTEQLVVMPKLFRRMVEFVSASGTIVGFKETLAQAQEPVFDLRDMNFTHFDTFVTQEPGSRVLLLTRRPEELVFGPMKDQPVSTFSALLDAAIPA